MSNSMPPVTEGIHHLGLTVPDINSTRDFFIHQLGFTEVDCKPDHPAVFISDGSVMLTLWQAQDAAKTISFNRQNNIGLHHFALKIVNQSALQDLYKIFLGLDQVTIEFAPEPLGETSIMHMMCFIPGGIRVEFIAA